MIARLTGTVDSIGADWVIVDVGGVGYLVYCSGRTLGELPAPGEPVRLVIETHVREDHIHLYGFASTAERDWYRSLSSVQGVGARMALAILSVLSPSQLAHAIAAQDKAPLTRASGVGPKLAGRILVELKDKVDAIALDRGAAPGPAAGAPAEAGLGSISEDAISALVNLGYGRGESFGAVAQATRQLGAEAPLDAVIKAGLKELTT